METVLRTAFAYLVIMLGFRLMGKRELSQLSPFELVTLLLVPEIFAQSIIGEDFSMANALVAFTTLLALVFATSVVAYLSRRVRKVIESAPAVLVANGVLVKENLDRERVTVEEIFSEMRMSGVVELSQVKWAILESDGNIAIVRADGERPPHPSRVEMGG